MTIINGARAPMAWTKEEHEATKTRLLGVDDVELASYDRLAEEAEWMALHALPGALSEIERLQTEVGQEKMRRVGAEQALERILSALDLKREPGSTEAAMVEITKLREDRQKLAALTAQWCKTEQRRYELGLKHGALLDNSIEHLRAVPVYDLARAAWETKDRGESFAELVVDHQRDDEGSTLSLICDEAEAVRGVLLKALEQRQDKKRALAPPPGSAFDRLEALVLAGPVELRAAWNEWRIAQAAADHLPERRAPMTPIAGFCPECSWFGEWDPINWQCGGCSRTQLGSAVHPGLPERTARRWAATALGEALWEYAQANTVIAAAIAQAWRHELPSEERLSAPLGPLPAEALRIEKAAGEPAGPFVFGPEGWVEDAQGREAPDVEEVRHMGNLRAALTFFEEWAEQDGYGAFPGGDPRLFTPDDGYAAATDEQRARWREACAAWDRGERPNLGGSVEEKSDGQIAFVSNGIFGHGTIRWRNEGMVRVRDGLRAALADPTGEPPNSEPKKPGCPDGCGASEDAHCWNNSDWATVEQLSASLAIVDAHLARWEAQAGPGHPLEGEVAKARAALRGQSSKRKPGDPLPLSIAAEVLTDMLERLGGDGVTAALNYDGDDKKLADGLWCFVQELEEHRAQCELYAVLKMLGADKATLEEHEGRTWAAGGTEKMREAVKVLAAAPRNARETEARLAAIVRQIGTVEAARGDVVSLGVELTSLFAMARGDIGKREAKTGEPSVGEAVRRKADGALGVVAHIARYGEKNTTRDPFRLAGDIEVTISPQTSIITPSAAFWERWELAPARDLEARAPVSVPKRRGLGYAPVMAKHEETPGTEPDPGARPEPWSWTGVALGRPCSVVVEGHDARCTFDGKPASEAQERAILKAAVVELSLPAARRGEDTPGTEPDPGVGPT